MQFIADYLSVSTSLGQRYLDNILKLALGSNREQALSAIELIGSILRQGLVHPNQVSLMIYYIEQGLIFVVYTNFDSIRNVHDR